MKVDIEMKEFVKSAPNSKKVKYDADIKKAERQDVIANMKQNGYKLIADNEFFMSFAKKTATGMIHITVCEYID